MAKSDVGTITVYLEAQAQQFDAKMKAAGKSVGKFQSMVKKATGHMADAWSTLQTKISVVSGAAEAGFRSVAAAIKIFSGDIEDGYESLRKLPFGVGAVVDSMHDLLMATPYWSEAFAEQAYILEEHRKGLAKLEKQVKDVTSAFKAAGDFRSLSGKDQSTRLRRLTTDDDLAFDRAAEIRKLDDELLGVERTLVALAAAGKMSHQAAQKAIKESYETEARRRDIINEYYDRLTATADLEKKVAAIQGQAADNLRGLHNEMDHDLHLLAVRGAEEAEIADMRLRKHKAITDALEDQRAALERAGASGSIVADAAKQIAEHATSGIQDLEIRLESLLAKQRDMKAQGPDVTSMSFSTAVGSIVLPDRRQANVTRREQLIAARKTNELIAKTNDRLMALGTTMP
jgi:Txe/YoeB family toxin of Txe-Axe toxin-antitoxin module